MSILEFRHIGNNMADGTACRGDSVVMTRFGGGYFDGAGKPYYELADYQGNITTVIDSVGAVVSHTGFYPYGQPWRRPGELQWLYGGKEWLGADGRDEYDFHARRQYPHLGIFTTPDPMAEATHWISSYVYCEGNPINAVDPTGRLNIFINGWHNGFEGGKAKYWNGVEKNIMNKTNDNKSLFIDGSCGGAINTLLAGILIKNTNPSNRYKAGIACGIAMAPYLLYITDKNETIRIFTHSMGAAFAKGFIQALKMYFNLFSNHKIYEIDFAPFQPSAQRAIIGVDTYVYQDGKDFIANNGYIKGAHCDDELCDIDIFKIAMSTILASIIQRDMQPIQDMTIFIYRCIFEGHAIINYYETIDEYLKDNPSDDVDKSTNN